MPNRFKLAEIGSECVACGCCVRVCPRGAVQVLWGIRAQADPEKCIGCGACVNLCPSRPFSAIYVTGHQMHRII